MKIAMRGNLKLKTLKAETTEHATQDNMKHSMGYCNMRNHTAGVPPTVNLFEFKLQPQCDCHFRFQ